MPENKNPGKYRVIACDLDETLLSSDRSISHGNLEAIRKARELGVRFVPATGRGYHSVEPTLRELGLSRKKGEYVISFNGGAITENYDHRLLHFEGISFDLAQELYRRGRNYDVCVHIYTRDMTYLYNVTPEDFKSLSAHMAVTEISSHDLDFLKGTDIVKALYMNTDHDYLCQIEKDYQDLAPFMDVSYSSNRFIEFNRRGVNKGAGLLSLAELLGIKPEEIIAIGDNFNDLSMIRAAGLGVGVKNSIEGIKKDCDYITTATNDESAVAEVIEKIVLS